MHGKKAAQINTCRFCFQKLSLKDICSCAPFLSNINSHSWELNCRSCKWLCSAGMPLALFATAGSIIKGRRWSPPFLVAVCRAAIHLCLKRSTLTSASIGFLLAQDTQILTPRHTAERSHQTHPFSHFQVCTPCIPPIICPANPSHHPFTCTRSPSSPAQGQLWQGGRGCGMLS